MSVKGQPDRFGSGEVVSGDLVIDSNDRLGDITILEYEIEYGLRM